MNFVYRQATLADIPDMHRVRMSVTENALADPSRVQPAQYVPKLTTDRRGWVCIIDGVLRGFSVADRTNRNIWALFVEPGFERRGIGRCLHDMAVDLLFAQDSTAIWLTTQPGTRADGFYRAAGWQHLRTEPNGENRFEMTR